MSEPRRTAAVDLVPLADRIRYMRLFRLAAVLVVAAVSIIDPEPRTVSVLALAAAAGGYLAASLAAEALWRLGRSRGLLLFGAMLMTDAVYLSWAAYATGGTISAARYLIVAHLVVVCLLASYRTGLKLALWYSLLLLTIFYAQQSEILAPVGRLVDALPGTEYRRTTTFIVTFWLITVLTSAFSAINERELRRRRFDLEALAQLGADLEGAADSFDVADALLDRLGETFEFERMLLLGAPEDDLVLFARRGSDAPIGGSCPAGANSALLEAWAERQTLLVSELDPEVDTWLAGAMPDAANLIIAPLSAENRAVGVLVIEHALRRASRVERRVVSMVERFASHASLALRNAWLLEQVQKMATTDGLTGIANRRSFDIGLERELSRATRNNSPLAVILIDLDHFKVLNDTHGHQVGDEVLRLVGGSLADHCRDFDMAARYGGEEFAVILPGCSETEAVDAAERLRRVVSACDSPVEVTASVGVASFPGHGATPGELVKAADDALYQSKRAGRDRVTVAG
ncbi:MAG TPA: sensor domain-containing diguanylate cyclase [Acidimicrobiales bacterium]|jgi:diguanylate cyclase (GGDEF)-like protein|nr:sensor domain-containing diguanylate cyclase [Acidimicrobiales bacterium]